MSESAFQLEPAERDLVAAVGDFADQAVAPAAAAWERQREFPLKTLQDAARAGYLGLLVPRALGGLGLRPTAMAAHNWMNGDYAPEMFRVMARALKPGGVLGVVEHRAPSGRSLEVMKRSGYVTEAHVIALAEQAGLVLEAESDLNSNPRDSADHPAGVWTLPPSLRHCRRVAEGSEREACIERYRAIGKSDRMTLRFRKGEP